MKTSLAVLMVFLCTAAGYSQTAVRLSSATYFSGANIDSISFIYNTTARGHFVPKGFNFFDGYEPESDFSIIPQDDTYLPGIIPYDTAYTYVYYYPLWKAIYRGYQEFDTHNNIISYTLQFYDTKDTLWVNSNRNTYTYDLDNNITAKITQTFDTATKSWNNVKKVTCHYSSGKADAYEEQHWMGGSWINYAKDILHYNALGKQANDIQYFWNATTHNWTDSINIANYYNAYGEIDSVLWFAGTSGGWSYQGANEVCKYKNHRRVMLTSNSYSKIIVQENTIYDSTHHKISSSDSMISSTPGMLQYDLDYWYLYDSAYRPTELAINTTSSLKVFYHYETYAPTAVHNVVNNSCDLTVYPNPSNGNITLSTTQQVTHPGTVTVYNSVGQQVFEKKDVSPNSTLHLPLPDGMYVLKYTTDKEYAVKQLVIRR